MKIALFLVGMFCSASCSSAPVAQDAGLPKVDLWAYVTLPKDPSEARRAVRLLNTSSDDPSRSGITESLDMKIGKLGRLGFALMAEEIKDRWIRYRDMYSLIQNNPRDPLVCPALFEKLVRAKSGTGDDRLT